MAPPNNVPLFFVKVSVPLISTLALSVVIHPPALEENRLVPEKLNGK